MVPTSRPRSWKEAPGIWHIAFFLSSTQPLRGNSTLCRERDLPYTPSWPRLNDSQTLMSYTGARSTLWCFSMLAPHSLMRLPPYRGGLCHETPAAGLAQVIRDASAGAVDSVLKFARDNGDTLALSCCATHLVDLLWRADLTSVTNQQRSWFFRRFADRLRALPSGGWELAATYLSGGGGGGEEEGGDEDEAELLRMLVRGVVPGSERAAHELVGWCRANDLGEEAAAAVCRARGAAWLGKTGFSAEAMGTSGPAEEEEEDEGVNDGTVVSGACGKAAYWLAKGGGGVQLERLCAEVSERLMVEVSPRADSAADVEVRKGGKKWESGFVRRVNGFHRLESGRVPRT